MRSNTALAALVVSLSAAPALAQETATYLQSNPVNVKAVVLYGGGVTKNVVVEQNGYYNAAAVVSIGGGYSAIYQRGVGNDAMAAQYGSSTKALIDQVQVPVPDSGLFAIMRRR